MDFWAHQEDARRRTVRLIALYAVLVLLLALAAGFAISLILREVAGDYSYSHAAYSSNPFFSPDMYVGAVCVLVLIGILCLFSPTSLSAGGKSVAESLKGALIAPQTTDAAERRLLNVVEEMALASGTPVPPVYILANEPGINAFAAGCTINDAVIGVTRGTVDLLTREELQAVIAHEFSHICNGDMKLGLRFTQLLFGLLCLADFSGVILRGMARGSSRRGGKDSGKTMSILMLLALVAYLTGIVMAFVGNVIQAAVSREREFLADASSVQFTRTQALASALKKIGGLAAGSQLNNTAMTGSYRHLFFCSIHAGLFDTHPSLESRIRRLDPQWDGKFTAATAVSSGNAESAAERKAHSQWQNLRNKKPASGTWLNQVQNVGSVAESQPEAPRFHADEAEVLLRGACREPLEASYMMLGLLLDSRADVAGKQLAYLGGQDARNAVRNYQSAFAALTRDMWLQLIELAVPALKTFSKHQFDAFCDQFGRFIATDGVFSFREWIFYQLVVSQVGAQFHPKAVARPFSGGMPEAAAMVLSALARLVPGGDAARCAFDAGKQRLNIAAAFIDAKLKPEKLSESVAVLAGSPLKEKEAFMQAASCVVLHDERIAPEEAMFLRVLSLCLGVPVPPEAATT